jgi:hypothetical protein
MKLLLRCVAFISGKSMLVGTSRCDVTARLTAGGKEALNAQRAVSVFKSSEGLAAVFLLAISGIIAFAAPATKLDDPVEGQKLARELRSTVPTEEAEFKGLLRLSAPNTSPREIPLQSKIVLEPGSWSSVYTARLADGELETLRVRHAADKPNEYEWSHAGTTRRMNGEQATNAFAGSDFALCDLGLEFFHWPTQLLARREMRKGRGCDVLESRPAQPLLYSRVLSWIDQETRAEGQPGLLMAEAHDKNEKLLKEFEIKGFTKVAGRWQVREMEIRNRQTKTSTRLIFEFDKE